jgi:uncharacterized membrane protein YkoI
VVPFIHGVVMALCSSLRSWWIVVITTSTFAVAAWADSVDQDALRRAVQSGEIRPLVDILTALRGKLPGQITGTEVERKHGRWIYEFRVADDKGRLFEVYVDARTGDVERTKEK